MSYELDVAHVAFLAQWGILGHLKSGGCIPVLLLGVEYCLVDLLCVL